MTTQPFLGRRGFLLGGAAVGAGALLTACTSNPPATQDAPVGGAGNNAQPGKPITIGFSAPAADHGWIAAITKNARAQAGAHSDVTLKATEGTNDLNLQIGQ